MLAFWRNCFPKVNCQSGSSSVRSLSERNLRLVDRSNNKRDPYPMVRYIENPLTNEVLERAESDECTKEWLLKNAKNIAEEIIHRPRDDEELNDVTPYTGLSGIALGLLRAAPYLGDHYATVSTNLLERCQELESHNPAKQGRYLCGDLGAFTVRLTRARDKELEERIVTKIVPALLDPSFPCDELLYGRAGLLAAASWLKTVHGTDVIPPSAVEDIISAIVSRGRVSGTHGGNSPPLMWQWHDSEYLGAAHGVAGILHLILSFDHLLTSDVRDEVMRTADWMLSIQDETGNFPSSTRYVGRVKEEPLVHWCHGAPGVIYLLITMHRLRGTDVYLQGLLRSAELIWKHGILKKGPGLCHGVSGNAYAMLAVWRHTDDEKWLRRARCFARLVMSPDVRRHQRTPDAPYSLYEGWTGGLSLLIDLLHPERAQFPLYPIVYY